MKKLLRKWARKFFKKRITVYEIFLTIPHAKYELEKSEGKIIEAYKREITHSIACNLLKDGALEITEIKGVTPGSLTLRGKLYVI